MQNKFHIEHAERCLQLTWGSTLVFLEVFSLRIAVCYRIINNSWTVFPINLAFTDFHTVTMQISGTFYGLTSKYCLYFKFLIIFENMKIFHQQIWHSIEIRSNRNTKFHVWYDLFSLFHKRSNNSSFWILFRFECKTSSFLCVNFMLILFWIFRYMINCSCETNSFLN